MLEKIKEAISEPLKQEGITVCDVTLEKQGNDDKIVITIDCEGVMDMDTCVKATHIINPIVDEIDPLKGEYLLEVTSKGIEEDGE